METVPTIAFVILVGVALMFALCWAFTLHSSEMLIYRNDQLMEELRAIDLAFQQLTQPDNSNWRVLMTPAMVNLQWEKAILYPAGYFSRQIQVAPSVVLPAGWKYGTALTTASQDGDVATFAPTDLYTLIDSPMFAGAHYRRVDIDPSGDKVHLNIVADEAKGLTATEDQLKLFENMVQQADRLFDRIQRGLLLALGEGNRVELAC